MSSIATDSIADTAQAPTSEFTLGDGVLKLYKNIDDSTQYIQYHSLPDQTASLRLSQGPEYPGSTKVSTEVEHPFHGSGAESMAQSSFILEGVAASMADAERTEGFSVPSDWEDVKAILDAAKPVMGRAVKAEQATMIHLTELIEKIERVYVSHDKEIEVPEHQQNYKQRTAAALERNKGHENSFKSPELISRAAAAISSVVTDPKDKSLISYRISGIAQRLAVLNPAIQVDAEVSKE